MYLRFGELNIIKEAKLDPFFKKKETIGELKHSRVCKWVVALKSNVVIRFSPHSK